MPTASCHVPLYCDGPAKLITTQAGISPPTGEIYYKPPLQRDPSLLGRALIWLGPAN